MQTANKVSQQQLTGASGQEVTCLRFTGDVSSLSKDAIVGTYQSLDKATHKRILLDFKGVEYLNSSGIALVIQVLMGRTNPIRPSPSAASPRTSPKSSPWSASPSTPPSTPTKPPPSQLSDSSV